MAGKKGMKHYPTEIKLEAMRLFYEEGKTRSEVTKVLGIKDPDRVKAWLRQYRVEGEKAFNKPIGRPRKQAESEKHELERLRMENKLLKKLQSELQKDMLAKRDFGRSTTTRKNTE
jgi:transposase-like protein